MSIGAIRDGIATNLRNIPGLRAAPELIDNPNPPVALIQLDNIEYDGAFAKGLVTYTFTIMIIVARTVERDAQRRLDAFALDSGAQSVKAAVESDKTLNGAAFDVRVERMNNINSLQLGDATYVVAEFVTTVLAS